MKTKLLLYASSIIIFTLSSCHLFNPVDRFDKKVQSDFDYVVYISKDVNSKVTSAINYPDGSRKFIDGMDVEKVLSKDQMNHAIFMYAGDFKDSEKRLKPIYMEEYRKWAIKEGYIT